ncbi:MULTISPECIES: DMT family transporter [Roseobacteraceae]|jgi:S-adenosylmethionine uptake transporter|uniref:Riboflavin transporter n=1 Tax=Pseudosulfitobacter pseudonitzschiae TaxID=1402135 RepID=A0A221K3J6_9RHOB|nr:MULTISPECIES: DMT family transporter [Roseobacteraceae]ASM73417.1 riboflavin transporter [Pseudosulfitobacter pseudonitzschiae]
MSPNVFGALLMMASMACFTFNDTVIKMTDGALPLGQLLTLRGIFSTVLIFALARYLGALRFDLRRRDWILVGIRSTSEISAAYFFITALMNMPLANISAIMQALPLTVTLGSALVFRESVGWRRAVAIGVGFVGMLLIVRPGTDGFNVWSLYGLLAVLSVTVRDLSTRRLSPDVPGMTVTLSAALAVLLFFAAFSLGETWQPVTPRLWAMLAGSAVFVFGGYYFSVQVMRTGDIAFIAPFRYTGLIWALLLGWLVFGDWPAPLTLLGAGIVVGMGLFTLYRERQLLKR